MELLKQHKETENKVHENLYNNLALLSAVYPTRREFDAVFRKDMFVKSNKVAFFEVIHYLLNILNPELTKQKLTSWPLYDVKREVKFRSELINYINELNLTYENADIPTCQPSSLISPGGFRFAKFMLKISQLVLYAHLKKSEQLSQLYRLKPHKNLSVVTTAQLCHLRKETQIIESETNGLLKHFEKNHNELSYKADQMSKRLTEVNQAVQTVKKELNETEQEFNLKYPSYPSVSSLEEKLDALRSHIHKILELNELFCSGEKLLQHISGSNLTLEHYEDAFTIPNEICHIITNKKELSLVEFFRGLTVLLERKALELRSPTSSRMEHTMPEISIQSAKYQMILKQLDFQQDHINNLLDELGVFFNEVLIKSDDTALALPLS